MTGAPAEGAPAKEADPLTLVPETPDGYKLDIGENGDKELLTMYQAKAHGRNRVVCWQETPLG